MKTSNKKKIETLLLYCTQSRVAEMINMRQWEFLEKLSDWSFTPEDEKLIGKIKPLKQIVLILSSQFMKSHPRAGEPTYFKEKIELAVFDGEQPCIMCDSTAIEPKFHTIRAKYKEWKAKIDSINRGEAFLRVVTWSGVPYRSPWLDVCVLTDDDGIGVQELVFLNNDITQANIQNTELDEFEIEDYEYIAKNDGLTLDEFKSWFKGYDLSEPLVIIHFTKFRY